MRKLMIAIMAMLTANTLFASVYFASWTQDLSTYDWSKVDDGYAYLHYGYKAGDGSSNTYTFSKDLTIPSNVTHLSVVCGGDHPLIFDLDGWTWNLGKSGFYKVDTTTAKERETYPGTGYVTYKDGTINFYDSAAAGYDVGHDAIKLAGTWDSQQVLDMHITLDNAKFTSPDANSPVHAFVGTRGSTVTLTNGSELSVEGQILINKANNAADSIYSTGNKLFVNGGSKVSCKKDFYAVSPQISPTTVLDSDTHMTFEGEGTELKVNNTFYLSHKIGGNHLVLRNKATATIANGFQFAGGSLTGDGDYCGYNNSLVLESGAKLTSTGTFSMGSYGSTEKGANNCLVFIGDGAELYNKGQFMQSGENNQVIISNGTLRLNVRQYSFYQGYSRHDATADTKHSVNNNKLIFKGDHPRLCHDANGSETEPNRFYLNNNTVVVFELPENGEYKTVPIDFDNFNDDGTTKLEFPNIAKVCANLTKAKDVVLARCRIGKADSLGDADDLIAPLPEGCSIAVKNNDKDLVLHLEPTNPVATLTHNGVTVKYQDLAALNSEMVDGDKITLTAPVDELVLSGAKSISAALTDNNSISRAKSTTISDGITVSHGSFRLGSSSSVIAQDMTLMVKDATLNLSGQFMTAGINNTVILDNGAINVDYQFAVYIGHSVGENLSSDNHLIVKGEAPRLVARHINDQGVDDSCISIQDSCVEFYLPSNPAYIYDEPVFEAGKTCFIAGSCTIEFHNIAALQANLSEAVDIPLLRNRDAKEIAISSNFVVPLPAGCSISGVITDADGYSTIYLHVETKGFSDWLSANGLTDGDAVCANGLTARQNYVLGLNPNNANSKPQIAKGDNGKFRYSINTASGATVALQVQKSSDGTSFSDFGTAQDNSVEIDPTAVSAGETAYYRVKIDLGNGLFTEQILGVINVENGANPAAIGVPFGKIGGHDGPPDQDAVSVEDVLVTSALSTGDIIYVYDQANKSYQAWMWNGGAWTAINTVTKEAITPAGQAGDVLLPRGSAFWLERVNTAKPIILAGRYDTAEATTTIGTGWNLIASPKAASFNLNNNGVTGNGANDQILVPTAGAPIVYTCENGAWGRIVTSVTELTGGQKVVETSRSTENAKVPAGHGFWYISAGGNPTFNW